MAQNIDLSNLEEMLMNTTQEELEELQQYLYGNDSTPVYKCDKQPTGPLDIDKLRNFMETTAKNEEDWPELVPHIKKDKPLNNQEKPHIVVDPPKTDLLDDSIREALNNCSPEDFSELAAILGIHGLTTQSETNSHVKPPEMKYYPEEPENDTCVEESIKKLQKNCSGMTELNLNNIQDITDDEFREIFEALKTNSTLVSLSMSATRFQNRFVDVVAEALRSNCTLEKLNLNSNFLSGSKIVEILRAVNVNGTMKELRVTNQCPQTLGWKVEEEILELVQRNDTLKVLSADFGVPTVRFGVQKKLQDNSFNARRRL